jgi:hypothetical protein
MPCKIAEIEAPANRLARRLSLVNTRILRSPEYLRRVRVPPGHRAELGERRCIARRRTLPGCLLHQAADRHSKMRCDFAEMEALAHRVESLLLCQSLHSSPARKLRPASSRSDTFGPSRRTGERRCTRRGKADVGRHARADANHGADRPAQMRCRLR